MTGLPNKSPFSNKNGFMDIWNASVRKLWKLFPFITLTIIIFIAPNYRARKGDYGRISGEYGKKAGYEEMM